MNHYLTFVTGMAAGFVLAVFLVIFQPFNLFLAVDDAPSGVTYQQHDEFTPYEIDTSSPGAFSYDCTARGGGRLVEHDYHGKQLTAWECVGGEFDGAFIFVPYQSPRVYKTEKS